MGAIYKAEHIPLERSVCVKVMHPHVATDAQLVKRFHREARAASSLQHQNIVGVMDFGQADVTSGKEAGERVLYLVMEFIDGKDLADILFAEGPLDPQRLTTLMREVCFALDEAHAQGVVHRDLKPENIMVYKTRLGEERAKVLDFGIAKILDDGQAEITRLTMAGTVCGTPEYMSPEQARGKDLDGRSDLYALGVIMYQLLTGQLPFDGNTPIEIVTKHLTNPPVAPSRLRSDVPPALETLILRLLEKKQEGRPRTAMDAADDLERIVRALGNVEDLRSPTDPQRTALQVIPPEVAEIRAQRKTNVAPSEAPTPLEPMAARAHRLEQARGAPPPTASPSTTRTEPDDMAAFASTPSFQRIRLQPAIPAVILALLLAIAVGVLVAWIFVGDRIADGGPKPAPSTRGTISAPPGSTESELHAAPGSAATEESPEPEGAVAPAVDATGTGDEGE